MESVPSFTAIDFEAANGDMNSICQVGLARFESGKIVHTENILVQPPGNKYHWGNSRVHGIKSKDTINTPFFKDIWQLIEPYISYQMVVAHNVAFDIKSLKSTLAYYDIPIPPFEYECTYKLFNAGLKPLAAQYNIPLKHHDALSDAEACGQLYLLYLLGKTPLSKK